MPNAEERGIRLGKSKGEWAVGSEGRVITWLAGSQAFSILMALLLAAGLLAAVAGVQPASAAGTIADQTSIIAFPWVPNGEMTGNVGPWYGSINVQNLESDPVRIHVDRTAFNSALSATIPPHAALTLSAAELNLPSSSFGGSGAVVAASWTDAGPSDICSTTGDTTTCSRAPHIAGSESQITQPTSGPPVATGYSAVADSEIAWGAQSQFCTSSTDTNCNNVPDQSGEGVTDLLAGQGAGVGWDWYIYVTNIDASTGASKPAQVTIEIFGNGGTSVETVTFQLGLGGSERLVLPSTQDQNWPTIFKVIASYAVVASMVRVHGSAAMANTGQTDAPALPASTDGPYTMYAPLVNQNAAGWHTVVNVANPSGASQTVSVAMLSAEGKSVSTHRLTIPALGIQTVDLPALANLRSGIGAITAAIIIGDAPFMATVDAVQPSTGSAYSYNATSAVAAGSGGTLALPLFQKGLMANNVVHGNTSSIVLFNPDPTTVAVGQVALYESDGAFATQSLLAFSVAPLSSALVSAPYITTLTPGSQVSAVIFVTHGQVTAVSMDANYDLPSAGMVIFNLFDANGETRAPRTAPAIMVPVLLSTSISAPASLTAQLVQYSPNPFTVTATISNDGTASAVNVQASIALPDGLSLASGSVSQMIGELDVGKSVQVSWSVKAANQKQQVTLGYAVTATADNALPAPAIAQMTVPAIGATLCVLSNQNQPHQAGSTVVIKVVVCDPTTGADLSTSSMNVVAAGLTDAAGSSYLASHPGNSFPDNLFKFDPSLSTSGGFQFNLKTTGLPSGAYELGVTVDGIPTTNSVTVIIR